MPTLYFIRHAKTAMNADGLWSGRTDCSITAEGAEKAKKSFSLTADEFDYFYCSPLQRTQQTLKILGNHSEPRIDARIIERDFGEWEGKPYSILTSAETQMYIDGKIQPPNGETFQQVKDRVIDFVAEMFSRYRGNEKILIVTHATVCRMVRDVFLPDMAKGPIKNAQMIKVTESDFNDFKRRQKK
jgi:broad specificity phosphatase PhoE